MFVCDPSGNTVNELQVHFGMNTWELEPYLQVKCSTTGRPVSVIKPTVFRDTTTVLLNSGTRGLYAGGIQHTRRSPFALTRQIQPSSRNLNDVSGGTISSAAHGGR